ncbi:MAG: DUF3318 domain-containing protein [Cyanobacteria bacterium P01_D01_bin.123]
MYAQAPTLDPNEVTRLQALLPASSRDKIDILPAPDHQVEIIAGSRVLPWQRRLKIFIRPQEWQRLSLNQRSSLFLHKVGYHSPAITRQLDLFLSIAAFGGISLIVECVQRDPIGIAVSGGLSTLSLWLLRRDRTADRRLLAADAYAVDRLVLRGLPRIQAVESLGQALYAEAQMEGRSGNELLDVLRYQNLKRLAQRPAEDIALG